MDFRIKDETQKSKTKNRILNHQIADDILMLYYQNIFLTVNVNRKALVNYFLFNLSMYYFLNDTFYFLITEIIEIKTINHCNG